MTEEVLVILIGLLPCILSLMGFRWLLRRADLRLQSAIVASQRHHLRALVRQYEQRQHEMSPVRQILGREDCRFSARSAYLRCAVNPMGDCADCHWFELH